MIFLALLIGGLVSAVETKARRFIFWIEFLPKPDRNGVKGSLFALSALVTLISPLAVYVVHSCQRVSEEPKHSQYLAKLYVGTGKGECSCHLDYQRKGQAVTEVELPSPPACEDRAGEDGDNIWKLVPEPSESTKEMLRDNPESTYIAWEFLEVGRDGKIVDIDLDAGDFWRWHCGRED